MQLCHRDFHAAVAAAFLLFATSLGPVPSAAVAGEVTPEKDAHNRLKFAGRQRMLSQQIARNACFVMAGILPERFVAKTNTAVQQFDTALHGLRHGDENLGLLAEQNAEVLKALERVEVKWATLGAASRQIAAGDVHPVPMRQLIRLNLEVKDAMNEVVSLIRSAYGDDTVSEDLARTVDLAGHQRMLSQKASKEVCFLLLDIRDKGASGNIEKTIADFDAAMTQLLKGSERQGIIAPPNRQVKKQLERTDKVWRQFKERMRAFEQNPDLPEGDRVQLANLSDQVLREMDLAVWMYSE